MADDAVDAEQTAVSTADVSVSDENAVSAWIDQAGAFAVRTVRDVARSWTVLGTAVGLPAVMYLLLTATGDFSPTRTGTFAVGIAVLGAMISSLTVFGSQLAVDAEDKRFHAYRAMVVSPSADVVGRMVAAVGVAGVSLSVALLVGVASGAPIGVDGVVPALAAFGGLVGVSVVFAAAAVPVVVAANNERYAQFVLSLVAVFAFMLTGYNGILPSVAVLDESVVRLLPNALATRTMALQLVATDGVGVTQTDGWAGLLAVYGLFSTGVVVLLVRVGLYDRGVSG